MGRWAQRQRSGGGPTSVNFMTNVDEAGLDSSFVDYAAAVDASQFNPSLFLSLPSVEQGVTVLQNATRRIEIQFANPITGDTSLEYTDVVPGILTPQTIAY